MTLRHPTNRRQFLALCLTAAASGAALADQNSAAAAVKRVLNAGTAPAGVVFEIVSSNPQYLDTALDHINQWQEQLHARFPGLDVAVVSHGNEQFALTTAKQSLELTANSLVEELLGDDIALHVCGLHAEARGVSADEYPSHIDVAPSGPAKIAEYVDSGYVLIVL